MTPNTSSELATWRCELEDEVRAARQELPPLEAAQRTTTAAALKTAEIDQGLRTEFQGETLPAPLALRLHESHQKAEVAKTAAIQASNALEAKREYVAQREESLELLERKLAPQTEELAA
jgi:hypothetical protein